MLNEEFSSAYGGSQARVLIGATAAGLNPVTAMQDLQPTPQLTATLDP